MVPLRHLLLPILAFIALLPQAAPAEDDAKASYSYYLISCGNFIRHRENGAPSDISNTADSYYVAGWVSAYNRLKPDSVIPDDTTLDDIMLWLEEYCTDNPLSNLETGLLQLSEEVKPRSEPPSEPRKPFVPAPAPAPALKPAPVHVPVEGLMPLPY